MDPSSKQTLVKVVALIKQGDNKAAVKLLTELLGKDPQIEQGWYLLGVALQAPERKRFAFQHVLKLNPENQRAKQQLEKLGFEASLSPPSPAVVEPPVPPPSAAKPQPADELADRLSWSAPEVPQDEEQPETPAWAAPEPHEDQPMPPAWTPLEPPPAEETPEPPSWAAPDSPLADEPTEPAPWADPDSTSGEESPEPPAWAVPDSPLADEPTEPAPWMAPETPAADEEPGALSWLTPDTAASEESVEPPSWLEPERPEGDEPITTPSWQAPEPTPTEEPAESALWFDSEPFDESGDVELPAWAKDIPDTPLESLEETGIEPEMPSWAQKIEPAPDKSIEEEPRSFPAFSFERAEDEPVKIPEPEPEPKIQPEPEVEPEEPEKKKRRKTRKERKAEKLAAKQEEEEQAGEKTLQEELLGDEDTRKRSRFRWRPRKGLVIFIILMIICGGLGGGAYYYQDTLIPVVTEIAPTVIAFVLQQPTPTPDYTATPTFTPVIPPTMQPTWTPGTGDVGLVADTPTPGPQTTPTITPTPLPLQASIIEEMEKIEEQYSAIRELEALEGIDREMMPRNKFGPFMEGVAADTIDWEILEQQQIIYRALGFVADDYNAVEVSMNDLSDFVGGRYDPDQNKIFLTGTGFYGLEQFIYSYELGFALLNENYDIYAEFCQGPRDTCLAETSLVTGDVLLTQQLWLQTYPIQFNPDTYFDLANPAPLFDDYSTPPYFDASRNFAVSYGYPFVSHLYDDEGWQTINYAYRFPPETTEQVIHPEKYDVRESKVLLYDPDLLPVLGEGWELVGRETLGEWQTFLLLTAPDYPDAIRPEEEAAAAAAGWGGDTYQVYFNVENNTTVMTVHWNWDTSQDQEEFLEEFNASQAGRFQNAEFEGPDEGACWMLDDQYSCIYQIGRDVLWIFADDLAALEDAKAAFTQFP